MPRKPAKTTENTMNAIDEALNTPVNFQFCEVAESLGITDPELRERLEAKLDGNSDVHVWDTIPVSFQPQIDAIARDIESESTVRRLEAVAPSLPEVTEQPQELPILEETERPKKGKKQSTNLTKRKSQALKHSDENSQRLASGDVQVKQALHIQKGRKSGVQLATLELVSEDASYRQVKAEALVRKVAQLTSEIAAETDFDPIQILQEMGVNCNAEILEQLHQQLDPALGKLESAVAEITEDAWLNGVSLEAELGNLENLLNSNSY